MLKKRTGVALALAVIFASQMLFAGETYQIYFGGTHGHTAKSDGEQTATDHYRIAKQFGFDFYSITDHGLAKYPGFTQASYNSTKDEANEATDATFVALYGYEHSENDGPNGTGHYTVMNSDGYLDATGSQYPIPYFYDWLVNNQTSKVACGFNHPGSGSYNSFDYLTPARRDAITMLEVINSGNLHYDAFLFALNKGWRVAPIAGIDVHSVMRITNPSHLYRTGVLVPSLTRDSILDAMRARRVYATWDQNLKLTMRANGQIMGSVMAMPSSLSFEIVVSDPDTGDANDRITKIELCGNNGTVLASQNFSAHSVTWNPTATPVAGYYFVRVYAADKTDSAIAYSAPIWIDTALPATPSAPSNLSTAATSSSQIDLSWSDNASNETGFKIERKTGAGGAWSQIATTGANATSYSNTGLSASTQYFYRVRANNGAGDSGYSNEANATTQGNQPPATGVRVSGNKLLRNGQEFIPLGFSMVGLLSPNLTGTAGTAYQHYNQAELNEAKAWGANSMRFQISQRGFDPTDSLYNAAYIQRVRDGVALAQQNGLVVILSMQDQSLGGGDATPMPEPQTLRSWAEVTKYFNNNPEIIYEVWNEPMVKDTAAEWELWKNGGTYEGQTVIGHQQLVNAIRATGANNVLIVEGTRVGKSFIGWPGISDPLNQIALGIHPYLTSPINTVASWDQYFGNMTATYPVIATEWGANSGSPFAQTYWPTLSPQLLDYLKAKKIGLFAWSLDFVNTIIKDWNWAPNNFVGYQVGVVGCGPGELVKGYFQNYFNGIPAAPSNLRATTVSGSRIDLAWNDNSNNETGFKIERKTGVGGAWGQIATVGASAASYSNTGLAGGTQYFYRVRANNGVGDSGYSNEANATTQMAAVIGNGAGLRGDYFDEANLTNFKLTRTDATVNFDWGNGSPHASVDVDTFSVRWSGQVQAQFSEAYTFHTVSDDGVRLWVNNQALIDQWNDHAPTEHSGTITLVAGQKYNILIEHYENGGGATAQLLWSSASTAKTVVPVTQLYPAAANRAPGMLSPPTATPNPAQTDQNVAFTAAASDPDGDALAYTWNFGDGTSGSGASAVHKYTTAGAYTATVTAKDDRGGEARGSVSVTIVAPPPPFGVKINFQLAGAVVPAGYLADNGEVFGNRGNGFSYGWNVDNTGSGKDRDAANSPDQRYDTLTHMQKPQNPNASWELAVPNGAYQVRVVSGDPSWFNSTYKVNVENVLTVDGQPTETARWFEGTKIVTVQDGRLTVSNAPGGVNNKLCFIEITNGGVGVRELAADAIEAEPLSVTKLQLTMNFGKSGRDAYAVSGMLPTLEEQELALGGVSASIDVGAAIVNFTLDAKGKGRAKNGLLTVKHVPGKGWFFQAALKTGSWTPSWGDGGIENATVKNVGAQLPVTFTLGSRIFGGAKDIMITSTKSKTGTGR